MVWGTSKISNHPRVSFIRLSLATLLQLSLPLIFRPGKNVCVFTRNDLLQRASTDFSFSSVSLALLFYIYTYSWGRAIRRRSEKKRLYDGKGKRSEKSPESFDERTFLINRYALNIRYFEMDFSIVCHIKGRCWHRLARLFFMRNEKSWSRKMYYYFATRQISTLTWHLFMLLLVITWS